MIRLGRTQLQSAAKNLLVLFLTFCVSTVFTFTVFDTDAYAASDNPFTAETISVGSVVKGNIPAGTKNSTYHYYKFKTANIPGVSYSVKIANNDIEENCTRRIEYSVMDSDFVTLEDVDISTSRGSADGYYYDGDGFIMFMWSKGSVGRIKCNSLAKNKYYYIKVYFSNGAEFDSDITKKNTSYSIQVVQNVVKPSKPVFKSVKAGRKKLSISYKKANYANRYQIQLKKGNGAWKTYNNGTKLNKTFKKLSSKKNYKVRVRAQRKVNGVWYSSPWSKIKTIKVK